MSRILTIEEQADTLAQYLPGGKAFGSKYVSTSNLRALLKGLAEELARGEEALKLFRDNIVPSTTELFIDEWESALGIPDTCFTGEGTDASRRRALNSKLASTGTQRETDFEALATTFGVTIDIIPAADLAVFPFELPLVLMDSPKESRFTIIVNTITLSALLFTFPYTFPIVFENDEAAILECLFNKLKPANCNVIFTSF